MAERIQIAAALYQNAASRSRTDACKITQGHRKHQGAGTGNHKEHQRAPKPYLKRAQPQQRRNCSQKYRQQHNNRRINTSKTGDKAFRSGFLPSRVFHKLQYLHNRRFPEWLFHTDAECTVHVDAAAQCGIARLYAPRQGFPRQRGSIQHCPPFLNDTIQRNPFACFHQNKIADNNLFRRDFLRSAFRHTPRKIRTDIQQGCNGFTGARNSVILKCLAHLIKQHYKYGFRHFPNSKRANRRKRHQEIFIEHLPARNIFHCPQKYVIPENEVCCQKTDCFHRTIQQYRSQKYRKPCPKAEEQRSAQRFAMFVFVFMHILVCVGMFMTAICIMTMMSFVVPIAMQVFPVEQDLYIRLKFMHHASNLCLQFFRFCALPQSDCHLLTHQVNGNLPRFLHAGNRLLNFPRAVCTGQPFQIHLHFHTFHSFHGCSYVYLFIYCLKKF